MTYLASFITYNLNHSIVQLHAACYTSLITLPRLPSLLPPRLPSLLPIATYRYALSIILIAQS